MCGHVGVAGQIERKDVDAFHDLLWISAIRGRDGVGVAKVPYKDPQRIMYVKDAGDTSRIFDRKSYWQIANDDSLLLLGHNRSKTIGESSFKNAHPFCFGDIVGAHNGTLQSKYPLKDSHKYDTDSEALFYTIAEDGLEQTINKIRGSWALVWYDRSDQSLNFLRNKERPLYYTLDESKSTLFWASEVGMLYLTLNRHNIAFDGKSAKILPEDVHFKWIIPNQLKKPFAEPIRKKVKGADDLNTSFTGASRWDRNTKTGTPTTIKDMVPVATPIHPGTVTRVISISGVPTKQFLDTDHQWKCCPAEDQQGIQDKLKPGFKLSPEPAATSQSFTERVLSLVKGKIEESDEAPIIRCSRLIKSRKGGDYYIGYDPTKMYNRIGFELKMGEGCQYCSCNPAWGEPVKFLKDNTFLCFDCVSNAQIVAIVRDVL